jgi:hypothetical protein
MPDSSSEAAPITPFQKAERLFYLEPNENGWKRLSRLHPRVETGAAIRARSASIGTLTRYCLANIAFIMSLSTSVLSEALSGIAGLH